MSMPAMRHKPWTERLRRFSSNGISLNTVYIRLICDEVACIPSITFIAVFPSPEFECHAV
jgi:hypothetical protein